MIEPGETVILKSTKMLGVVFGHSADVEGFVVVRVWDIDLDDYLFLGVHPSNLEKVKSPMVLKNPNKTDKEAQKITKELLTDLALQTNDRAWFQQLQTKKPAGGALNETRSRRVRLGSRVKGNGISSGVIVAKDEKYPDIAEVMTWNRIHRRYVKIKKRMDFLQLDPVPEKETNPEDLSIRKSLKSECIELALATHDRAWFEELVGKRKEKTQ